MLKAVKKISFAFSMFGVLTCAGSISAQKITNRNAEFKNLAGEAREISVMRLPAPETLGARSKAAVIALENGKSEYRIPSDGSENFKIMIVASDALNIEIALPNGDFAVAKNISNMRKSTFGIDGAQLPAEVYELGRVESGAVRVRLSQNARAAKTAGGKLGYLVASSETPYRLYSYVNTNRTLVGEQIGIVSKLFDTRQNAESGNPSNLNGNLQSVAAQITAPDNFDF